MKKRMLAFIVAATMVLSSAVGVFAAGSANKNIQAVKNETTNENNYFEATQDVTKTDSFAELQKVAAESTALIIQVNGGEIDSETFLKEIAALEGVSEEVKQNIEGKDMLTQVIDLDKVGEPDKTVDGKYRVTLEIPGLTAKTTGLGLLHLTSTGEWEFIPVVEGSINLTKKTASFDFTSFSPVVLVADAGTVDTAATETDSTSKSPKTSQASNWMVWAVMAVLLAGAGVVALRKKEN